MFGGWLLACVNMFSGAVRHWLSLAGPEQAPRGSVAGPRDLVVAALVTPCWAGPLAVCGALAQGVLCCLGLVAFVMRNSNRGSVWRERKCYSLAFGEECGGGLRSLVLL